MDECDKCGGKLVRDVNDVLCKSCGTVSGEHNISFDRSFGKTERKSRSGYYNSRLTKHRRQGYKEPMEKRKLMNSIKEIYDLVDETLPEEDSERILKQYVDFVKEIYNLDLAKTREKAVIIYSTLISILDYEIGKLNMSKKKGCEKKLEKYSKALYILKEADTSLYEKSQKLRNKQLAEILKKANSNQAYQWDNVMIGDTIEWDSVMDFDVIDPKWKNMRNNDFHKLFQKKQYPMSEEESIGWRNKVSAAAFDIAVDFIKLEDRLAIQNGQIPKTKKREGLVCVLCYLLCEHHNLEPLERSKWQEFFNISKRTFQNRREELKRVFPGKCKNRPD